MTAFPYAVAFGHARSAPLFTRVETVRAPEPDTGGTVAPWWANVYIERVATADGLPLQLAFHDAYSQLFACLADLVDDGEISPEAAARAHAMLQRCMFAGAVAPKLTWHGGDAVVLIWSGDGVVSYFTIGADGFSFLEERDGEITQRTDEMPSSAWEKLFPLPHGVH
jgi:hypothetical protein